MAVDADFENAAGAWLQGEFADFLLEGCEEFLRHPGGAEEPAALSAVLDFYSWFHVDFARMRRDSLICDFRRRA